ncbi:hypothetical protein NP493_1702g00026 [Ridgeia piscesae]|uniref:Uncharacterized protein n=1 Tax=Ridgeia piscesae TaxID=27915 RepID=A0AAD9JUH1_RIDPI|nr:hypothetical protein NP493_1702g00026 [Ridgeia piscesae]
MMMRRSCVWKRSPSCFLFSPNSLGRTSSNWELASGDFPGDLSKCEKECFGGGLYREVYQTEQDVKRGKQKH